MVILQSILETERYQEQAYLTAGSLINAFCSMNDNCMRHYAVRDTLRFFEEKIGTNCQTSSDDMQYQVSLRRHQKSKVLSLFNRKKLIERVIYFPKQLMLALKAIGNAGQSNTVGALEMCAKEMANSAETRVAAMQAFRRMSCSVNVSPFSAFLQKLTSTEEL